MLYLFTQPPSGGCVLKRFTSLPYKIKTRQPPSGGCVLKRHHTLERFQTALNGQPPSGGCVLKRHQAANTIFSYPPAAFRRLCVETNRSCSANTVSRPAAFRRLCVETMLLIAKYEGFIQPPSGGCVLKPTLNKKPLSKCLPAAFRRLCVETTPISCCILSAVLPAAFRRLCVETFIDQISFSFHEPSRLQAAVC